MFLPEEAKNPELVQAIKTRSYTTSVCDKPTRKGHYIKFSARGLSAGFTWFVGYDQDGQYLEEFLGL